MPKGKISGLIEKNMNDLVEVKIKYATETLKFSKASKPNGKCPVKATVTKRKENWLGSSAVESRETSKSQVNISFKAGAIIVKKRFKSTPALIFTQTNLN
jgi:hypothetical protein